MLFQKMFDLLNRDSGIIHSWWDQIQKCALLVMANFHLHQKFTTCQVTEFLKITCTAFVNFQ